MRNEAIQRLHRNVAGALMVVMTTCLLALAYEQASRGAGGIPGLLVYAFAAGFGLEFLGSAWTGRWRKRDAPRRLHG